MKKKVLSMLLALTIVLPLTPVSVWAAEGNTIVTTVADLVTALGVAAPAGNTVTLDQDAELEKNLQIACNAVINLNGHSINMGNSYIRVDKGYTVKFEGIVDADPNADPDTDSNAIISEHGTAAIVAMRGSKIEFKTVSVKNEGNGYGIMVNPNPVDGGKTEIQILGTKISAKSKDAGGVYVHGNLKETAPDKIPYIGISGSEISCTGAGMYLAGTADTHVYNSTISGEIGIGIKAGSLEIKGENGKTSEIRGTGECNDSPGGNGNGINNDGSALEIEDHSGYGGNIKVTIEGGAKLVSEKGHAIHEFASNSGSTTAPKITIKGGTFESPESSIKTDQKVKPVISGGTFSKLDDLELGDDCIAVKDSNNNTVVWKATPQTIVPRSRGVEDNNPDADYAGAYRAAGLVLEPQATDGSYTLTIDRAKLQKVAAATSAGDELHGVREVLENTNNKHQLWFGMEYLAPSGIQGITKALVQFDGTGDFAEAPLINSGHNGFYNYIKVYKANADGSNGAVVDSGGGETAIIKWISADDSVLAVTKAEVKINVPQQYTVTFNTQEGSAVASQIISSGGKVTKPADPTKTGCTFAGWYKEAACTTAWNFGTDTVTSNTTLYAKWEAVTAATYTVTFDSQGGSTVASATVADGGKVTKPADPTKTGCTFLGWYKESACTTAWNFGTDTVTSNTTLYAKWEAVTAATYTVTFDSQNGSEVAAAKVKSGEKVKKPDDPKRDGYTFDGWYTDKEEYKTAWDFEKDTVSKDTTLYAKWKEVNTPAPGGDEDEYEIYVNPGIWHGSVSPSTWSAEAGERVTITVYPYTDYQLDWLEVVREDTGRTIYWSEGGWRHTFTMPASDVIIDAGFYLHGVYSYFQPPEQSAAQPAEEAPAPVFEPLAWRSSAVMLDVPVYSWAYQSAQWAYQNGYLDMAAGGAFNLNGPVSHQQMWRIMARWLDAPAMDDRSLTDWAMQNGAAMGSSPSGSMTRQDVVLYLYQCYFLMGGDVTVSGNLSEYADARLLTAVPTRNAWTWAVDRGIVSGTADGYLNPNSPVNRGEFAAMLMRLCQNVTK